jgi:hypothetical protein
VKPPSFSSRLSRSIVGVAFGMDPAKLIAACVECVASYNAAIDTVDVHVEKFLGPDPLRVRTHEMDVRDVLSWWDSRYQR